MEKHQKDKYQKLMRELKALAEDSKSLHAALQKEIENGRPYYSFLPEIKQIAGEIEDIKKQIEMNGTFNVLDDL